MRARTMVISITVLLIISGVYVIVSDQFGRPERPLRPLVRETYSTILEPPPMRDPHSAAFTLCAGPIRANCVVDGDTFWFEGTKFRIADIDAPEISEPHCPSERQAGEAAKRRLLELLNDAPFSLIAGWRDEDRFGRKLRIVTRDYRSLGETLVKEGLARNWDGPRLSWCN